MKAGTMKKGFEEFLRESGEVGVVELVTSAVVIAAGLPGARLSEMVLFESGEKGQVSGLSQLGVEILVFSRLQIRVGTRVARTDNFLTVAMGEGLLGKTINALGEGGEEGMRYRVDVVPMGITSRRRISRPLETRVLIIDLMIPLGRGQKELVMGDRKTGKSQVVLQAMLNQARLGSICVYAAVGKRRQEIKRVEEFVAEKKISAQTAIVAASSEDSAGEVYISPYTAMTIAEYFRDTGRDVLLVVDDLLTHAKYYRELSLLSRKFPGRESYPGDVFHVHSRLLERGGNFVVNLPASAEGSGGAKEAAITVLPIVDTIAGDITGDIPPHLMPMTDGHIYFDAELFFKGRRPAIDPFVSVTRVGYQTLTSLQREIARELSTLLLAYEKTQSFLRFGTELGENSRRVLALGGKVLAFFDQPIMSVVPAKLQTALLGWLWSGMWDGKDLARMLEWYETDPDRAAQVDKIVTEAKDLSSLSAKCRERQDLFAV